jgi:hypothetical protein
MHASLLDGTLIQMDETMFQVLKEKARRVAADRKLTI